MKGILLLFGCFKKPQLSPEICPATFFPYVMHQSGCLFTYFNIALIFNRHFLVYLRMTMFFTSKLWVRIFHDINVACNFFFGLLRYPPWPLQGSYIPLCQRHPDWRYNKIIVLCFHSPIHKKKNPYNFCPMQLEAYQFLFVITRSIV